MAKLEPSGSRIPDAESEKLMFPLIVTFYLTKTENSTKNHSKIKGALVLNVFFWNYINVYLLAKFEVSGILLTRFSQELPPTSKRTPKKSTQIRINM